MHFDVRGILDSLGYWGYIAVWAVIFLESGLFCFFLPGDSLLFTTGFLCSIPNATTGSPTFNIFVMSFGCFATAVMGNFLGYYLGHHYGRSLFDRDAFVFKKKYLAAAEDFYAQKGAMAIIICRFLAIVRTFAPLVAGMAAMRYRTFVICNVVGGFLWAVGLNVLGYFLGKRMDPDVLDKYLMPITLGVMVLSFIPSIIHFLQEKTKKH
jgi:membrane-associated protein